MEILQDFITAGQAAKLAGYNPDYVSQLIRAGKIRGKKVGKNWVTTRHELSRYIQVVGGKPLPIIGSGQSGSRRRNWRGRFVSPLFVIVAAFIAGFLALVGFGVYASIYNQALSSAQNGSQASSTMTGSTAAAGNIVTSLPQL